MPGSLQETLKQSPLAPALRAGLHAHGRLTVARGKKTLSLCGRSITVAVDSIREYNRVRGLMGEEDSLNRLRSHIKPGDTFYDVGANIGLFGLAVTDLLAPGSASNGTVQSGRVVAFEPEPRNFAHLARNFELNGSSTLLQAEQAVLADAEGAVELAIEGEVGEGTHNILARGGDATRRVRAETMDAYAARTGFSPDVIKIDVEGAELLVVRGMADLLARRVPRAVLIELHRAYIEPTGEDPDEVRTRFESAGYTLEHHLVRGGEEHLFFVRGEDGGRGDEPPADADAGA